MSEEKAAIAWIKANPDLLERYPELLDDIRLPHAAGTASLIERQVERLRRDNQALEQRLRTLASIAGENERLMQRLHQLTLEVLSTDSTAAFLEQLFDKLAVDFRAERLSLHLFTQHDELAALAQVQLHPEQAPEWCQRVLAQGRIECGRFTRAKFDFLFGEDGGATGSAALVPIHAKALLAIGANSDARFHPAMGTLFLELLGTTIRHRLANPGAEHRKRVQSQAV